MAIARFRRCLQNVVEFRVFYRFDDAAYAAGASGITNAVPFGGSIRDASFINGLAGAIDPWNYVVAVMVCLTLQTDELRWHIGYQHDGDALSRQRRGSGNRIGFGYDNHRRTHPPDFFPSLHGAQSCHSVSFDYLSHEEAS